MIKEWKTTTFIAFLALIFCVGQAMGCGLIIIERIIAGVALIILARFFKTTAIVVFVICLIPLFYLPAGLEYGAPAPGYVAAVFETNPQETEEFLSILPVRNFIYSALLAVILAISLFYNSGKMGGGGGGRPRKKIKNIFFCLV
ncbi:MAG: hypothetical protein LBP89_10150 [Helicobacteraceae bacterium]|jgi:glucan phosphoethanolaminetransferase (alkaline phosphatase superfamily)|nr:hypothetical protein [Helicobacteraceae bacterium]